MILIESDGNEKSLATVSVPKTGKDVFQVKSANIRNAIKAGKQKLRISITGDGCVIDKIELKCTTAGITDVNADDANQKSYDLFGRSVDDNYKGIIIKNGKKHINR